MPDTNQQTTRAMGFADHFSGHSADYAAFRPRYPESLFSWLASECIDRSLAWDCATGSGQAATALAQHFRAVIATDASANQLANASAHDRVTYRVAPAEDSGISADSVDLITVAQALHWFDLAGFTAEASRVLKPGGVLAAWTYGLIRFGSGLDTILERFYGDIVGEYWPFERRLVEGGYVDLVMPFDEVPVKPMEMTATWSFADLVGYLNTWSATKAYEKARGRNPLDVIQAELVCEWGEPDTLQVATWPLATRVWRKPAS